MTKDRDLTQLIESYARIGGPAIHEKLDESTIRYQPICSLVEEKERIVEELSISKNMGSSYNLVLHLLKEGETFLEARISDTSKGPEAALTLDYQLKPDERLSMNGLLQPSSQVPETLKALSSTYTKALKGLKIEDKLRDYVSKHGAAGIITSF